MKSFLLSLLLLFTTASFSQSFYYQQAQKGNPGLINNENDQESDNGGGWVLIMDSAARPSYSAIQALPIGFDFRFAGQAVTHFKVSSTGFLTFDTLAANAPIIGPEALPSNNLPNQTISIWGMEAFGNNDKVICKVFGNPPIRQFWVKFYSMSTPGDSLSYHYWSMVLEEGSHDIYLVSMNHGAVRDYVSPKHSLGIQISATNAKMVSGSPNILNVPSGDSRNDNFYYRFIYGNQPTTDVSVTSFKLPALTLSGKSNTLKIAVKNEGAQSVTSLKLNYQLNGGAIQTYDLNGLNILPSSGSLDTLSVPGSIAATIPGEIQRFKVWVSDVNGGNELNTSNDSAIAHTTVYAGIAPKNSKVLLEYATGAWCTDCPPADAVVEKMKKSLGDSLVVIAHHTLDGMSLPGDSFVREKLDSFPAAIVQRNAVPVNQQIAVEGTANWLDAVRNALQTQRWADIRLSNLELDTFGLLSWKMKVKMLDYVSKSDIRVGAVVVEDNIRGNGQAFDQQVANKYLIAVGSSFQGKSSPLVGYFHQNVPVSFPAGIWGTPFATGAEVLKPGDSFEWNMSYRFDKLLKKEFMPSTSQYFPSGTDVFVSGKPMDMKVVAFLALNGQGGDRSVLAVTQSRLWELSLHNRTINKAGMRLYPNPANEHALLATEMTGEKRIVLWNAAGRIIREFATRDAAVFISTETLADGIYYLQCVGANQIKQATLMVRH